jgi:hypothetical protein
LGVRKLVIVTGNSEAESTGVAGVKIYYGVYDHNLMNGPSHAELYVRGRMGSFHVTGAAKSLVEHNARRLQSLVAVASPLPSSAGLDPSDVLSSLPCKHSVFSDILSADQER